MGHEGIIYAAALSLVSSPARFDLWGMIGDHSPREIYDRAGGIAALTTQSYISSVYSGAPLEAAQRIIETSGKKGYRGMSLWDRDYPPLLKEIHRPPLVLYLRGKINSGKKAAIVGTRMADMKSASITRRLSGELASAGYTIVSGMAIGIDREAHIGALDRGGGTVGILANGIDIVYPASNRDLYRRIETSEKSALLSEYPPGILAGKWTFVRRNRIISGLSLGTVVVKAGDRSGAMITARYALEQNRDVFACPGHSFDRGYAGCHRLLLNGAVPVHTTGDIMEGLEEFSPPGRGLTGCENQMDLFPRGGDGKSTAGKGPSTGAVRPSALSPVRDGLETELSDIEREVLGSIIAGMEIDVIVRNSGRSPAEVNRAVVSLELSGLIQRNGNYLSPAV